MIGPLSFTSFVDERVYDYYGHQTSQDSGMKGMYCTFILSFQASYQLPLLPKLHRCLVTPTGNF